LLGLQDVIAGNNSENRDNDQEISALRQIKKSAALFIIGSDRLASFGRALPSRTRGNVLVPGRLSSSRQGASKDTHRPKAMPRRRGRGIAQWRWLYVPDGACP
jgi:hypothetical protein